MNTIEFIRFFDIKARHGISSYDPISYKITDDVCDMQIRC